MLILLKPQPPYFRIAQFDGLTGTLDHEIGTHFNIVNAVRDYENNGGDV